MREITGKLRRLMLPMLWLYGAMAHANAMDASLSPVDLTGLSLEELMDIEVISVSKKAEPLFEAPAPVYVITGEEIRRSGARTLPDALRLAPGVEVAMTGPRSAAVTIRGFNETSADKLEVLVDGRSVYTPLTSAVFWQVLDIVMEDIERIEVVRGPGGTIWGANAVNGVVNIVTRSSLQDSGNLVTLRAGSELRGSAALRMHHRLSDTAAIRSYALARDFDGAKPRTEDANDNRMSFSQAGFRADWVPAEGRALRLSSDVYTMRSPTTVLGTDERIDDKRRGGNVNFSFLRTNQAGHQLSLAAYIDWYHLLIPQLFDERRRTYDLDLRYRFGWGSWNEWTLGLSYRRSEDKTGGPPIVIFVDPQDLVTKRPGAFIQDRMTWMDGRLNLTLGSKFERNDFTGIEFQPSARLGFMADERSFIGISAARAVRTPNRFDDGVAVFCSEGLATLFDCEVGENFRIGNPELKAETLTAYELLFRRRLSDRYSAELTLFSNHYDDLVSNEPQPPFGRSENLAKAESHGAEFSLTGQISPSLSLRSWLSYLDLSVDDSRSNDPEIRSRIEGSSPDMQASLALRWSRGPWHVDAIGRYVAELDYTDDAGERQHADAYSELDLRIARRFGSSLSLGLVGRNLLNDAHVEFPTSDHAMERAWLFELVWEPKAE